MPQDHYADNIPFGHGQYDGKEVYSGLSTASEVILNFTIYLFVHLRCNSVHIVYKKGILHQDYSQRPKLDFGGY